MDPRVHDHASLLIEWSACITPGDAVVVDVAEDAHDLGVAVAAKLGEVGATVTPLYGSDELTRAYLKNHDGDFEPGPPELALLQHADTYLRLDGGRNTMATADVSPDIRQAYTRTRSDIREARMATDWVSTVHPTRSLAQQAGMAYEEYQDFAYNAILRDWEALAEQMANVKTILDDGTEVHITKERENQPTTDITMSIEGRTAVNSAASVAYNSHNLPSGEVFTAPYDPEGEIFFDVPMTINGRRVRDVHLVFRDGSVVEYSASTGSHALGSILDTDPGARRLGELGIGMNRGIDRFTDNILFDEKMGDTVHLAVGRAYDANLPAGETGNHSAVHVDFISDMSRDSCIEVDGSILQRNGTFVFEDGSR